MGRATFVPVFVLTALVAGHGAASSSHTESPGRPARVSTAARAPKRLAVTMAPWQLPAPLSREVVLNDGRSLLVYGGQDASHNSTATASAIDPENGAVNPLAPLSPAVHDAAGARTGRATVIIAGGTPPPRATVQALPVRGPAMERGRLPAPRTDHVAATIGKTIYVLGGAQDEGLPIASVLASSDSGATWHDAGSLAQPARYPAVAVVRGAIYLFGGVTTANGADTTAIQRYNPRNHTTRVVGLLPAPLSHASAVAFGDAIFVLGGYVDNVPSAQILRFDARTATIAGSGSLPMPLTDAAATLIGDVGYLVGGEGPGRSTTSHVELVTPH